MALVHNNFLGVFAGVSTQAIDMRLPNHCEEMVNVYPSIQYGLRRRNPTIQLSNSILSVDKQFVYTYDRGLSGEASEQYLITIDPINNLRVLNIGTGEYQGVTYSGNALSYLQNSNPNLGFSALTIKDTTFISNKDIIPKMQNDSVGVINFKSINLNSSGFSSNYPTIDNEYGDTTVKSGYAPARIKTYQGIYSISGMSKTFYTESSAGAITTITIDSVNYSYITNVRSDGFNIIPESLLEYRSNIYSMLSNSLDPTLYTVRLGISMDIKVFKKDGTAISLTATVTFPASVDILPLALTSLTAITLKNSDSWHTGIPVFKTPPITYSFKNEYNIGSTTISSVTSGTSSENIELVTNTYDSDAFIWFKSASVDSTFPYTYTATIYNSSGGVVGTHSYAAVDTDAIATNFATWANGLSGYTAISKGSVTKITRTDHTAFSIVVSDTYGSQATSAWKGSVTTMGDLPKHFPFKDTIVKIDGVQRADDIAYWVKYDGNTWIEWRDPNIDFVIAKDTMPHKLTRNADFSFTLSAIEWDDMLVGDGDTQSTPNFIGEPIQDIFFINSRLGFLTANGITLSQQDKFTNFFRTTILDLLDDSPINTFINSAKAVGLRYAVELQGYIILFGDKQQFAIDATHAISPKTISVQSVSGYEINRFVKPISIGDSIMFVVQKGDYSALMEMNKNTLSLNIKAEDVSSHVTGYIDSNITQLIGSPRNDCVFLRGNKNPKSIYVYKFYSEKNVTLQKAWSRWEFAMDISSIFSFDRYLYLFGNRYITDVITESSFEQMQIESYGINALYKDNGAYDYVSFVELSEWAIAPARDNVKEIRGTLLLKTIEISSSEGSDFSLNIIDKERGKGRSIPSIYTVNRKPYLSGTSKNTRIIIDSVGDIGFQINSISIEGQYNTRSKRV
jgi:hypothetical protein